MPDHKNQHYVPRCHLKPFSVNGDGKAINLLNINKCLLVQNAPIKNQCAKAYFYGKDLVVERGLQEIEGKYASIVSDVIINQECDYEDLKFLRDFSYLQYLRTDTAARRTAVAQEDMTELIFEREPEESKPAPFTQNEIVQLAIKIFSETVGAVGDLKVCLVSNKTSHPFITSDDPAVMLNRFYAQRLGPRWKSPGIGSAGAMFVLPLSPSLLMYSYDGDIYTCPDGIKHMVKIDKESDAVALNMLQYIKASQNIYFSDWSHGELVRADLSAVAGKRPEKWHDLHFAVKDDDESSPGSQRYRVVYTEAERAAAEEALVHLESLMLDPGVWLSKIKFRHKLKYVYTNTGAGYRRRSGRYANS
jgi:hypothetical protein